ncbi:MAG TPA: monofunctional biosynthetic peptidoglycan transglycosylase [Balneolaceae bacterium]|nr:monofunctional biosynthetic peptidoglycan transglycosylase [Balneolaceae bacterium]
MNDLRNLNHLRFSPKVEYPFFRTGARWLGRIAVIFIGISVLVVIPLRWINPPTSSFMLQREFKAWKNNESHFKLHYRWVEWKNISPHLKMAAITSEDQRFAYHWGIDFHSIEKAVNEYEKGRDLRGASTITQQVAKNLFLWQDHSFIRKGIEAYFALLLELCWSKQRILEVYLNIAEFGDGIYGAQAAARHFFDTSAASLSKAQSALMVTALPAPTRYNLSHPSSYMYRRQRWVMRYMNLLGESYYLQKLK